MSTRATVAVYAAAMVCVVAAISGAMRGTWWPPVLIAAAMALMYAEWYDTERRDRREEEVAR